MGLNAYFTYTVVKGMGIPWETALGAVFLSRRSVYDSDIRRRPAVDCRGDSQADLYAAVASGIGLFIAMIGLRNAGIVVASPATLVTIGNLRDKSTLVAIFGLLIDHSFARVGRSCSHAARDRGDHPAWRGRWGLVKWSP